MAQPSRPEAGLWLWEHVPQSLTEGWDSLSIGFALSILSVYMMAEFNNKFVLLRVSSRMLSSILAILLTTSSFLHEFQPAHVILALLFLAYFPLFASYQRPDSMTETYLCFLSIGLIALIFPKIIFLIPAFWLAQIVLRSLSARTLAASLLGIATPLWFLFAITYVNDNAGQTFDRISETLSPVAPDYSLWNVRQWTCAAFAMILGLSGMANFYMHSHLDKTRTRVFVNIAVIMFVASLIMLLVETSHFNEIYPVLLINTSILAGHHISQNYTKPSNIYTIIAITLAVGVAYINFTTM